MVSVFSKPVKSKSNEKQVLFSVFLFYGPQGAADISTALFPSANSVLQSKRMLVKLIGDSRLAVDPDVRLSLQPDYAVQAPYQKMIVYRYIKV